MSESTNPRLSEEQFREFFMSLSEEKQDLTIAVLEAFVRRNASEEVQS